MKITDIAWVRDHRERPVLELKLDGHPVHIRVSQKTELTRRGILDGVVFLNSERGGQLPNLYIEGDFAPEYDGMDLVGCTDDPEIFRLYQEMCDAIRTDTWCEGPRPLPVSVGHAAEPQSC